jgi:FkbM family methyltransferase
MSLGCRVLAFEPQARLLPAFKRSLYFNNFDSKKLLALIPCALAHNQKNLTSQDHHNWGEWSLSRTGVNDSAGSSSSPSDNKQGEQANSIHSTTLDSFVQEDVLVRLIAIDCCIF